MGKSYVKSTKADVYQIITDRILDTLKQGVIPWRKSWAMVNTPVNYISKKAYRGINTFILGASSYSSPYWASFKQISDKGGKVKTGEHGTYVVYWKIMKINETNPTTGEVTEKNIPLLRYYVVFNMEQTEGINYKNPEIPERTITTIAACEELIEKYTDRPTVSYGGDRACYSPSIDAIKMPTKEQFTGNEEYYSTLFHEFVHSTGHKDRLNRDGVAKSIHFGSERYSKEELVAEMGAAFLCAFAGIENAVIDNSAAYIANWITSLQNDPKMVVQAAGAAQKAVDYMNAEFITDAEEEEVMA